MSNGLSGASDIVTCPNDVVDGRACSAARAAVTCTMSSFASGASVHESRSVIATVFVVRSSSAMTTFSGHWRPLRLVNRPSAICFTRYRWDFVELCGSFLLIFVLWLGELRDLEADGRWRRRGEIYRYMSYLVLPDDILDPVKLALIA